MHGHNYKLRVTLEGEPDPETGMIIDFYDLKDIVEEKVIQILDHSDLGEILDNPTAEMIVILIWNLLSDTLSNLYELNLWEVDECSVTYRGPRKDLSLLAM